MTEPPDITPETKVGALLDARPELFEPLVAMSPEFRRLKNPVLRKTIGRVATLARAARMAELDPIALVNRLRGAAGLAPLPGEASEEEPPEPVPAWVERATVRATIDADARLAAGENPLAAVNRAAADLEPGEAVVVRSSFRPAPLVDALRKADRLEVALRPASGGWETFVRRA